MFAWLGGAALATVTRAGSGAGSGTGEEAWTARLLSAPFGQALVAAVAAVILGYGLGLAVQGLRGAFLDHLEAAAAVGMTGTAITVLGQVGYVGKGMAIAIVGGLFGWAALTHDADKAGGLDQALQALLEQPHGRWLLVAVSTGIACYGCFCLAWARYPDTDT